MPRLVEGEIELLSCKTCGVTTPHFVFSGDSDQETDGLFSTSLPGAMIVVLAEFTSAEHLMVSRGDHASVLERVERESGVDGLRTSRFLRTEGGVALKGRSFAEFRKQYVRPDVVYACPSCLDGEAVSVRAIGVDAFVEEGGRVIALGGIVPRN